MGKRIRTGYYTLRDRRWKAKAVAYKGGKCCICGYSKCAGALDFHHVDPKTKNSKLGAGYQLHKLRAAEKWAELDKCILVCSNCHAEIHAGMTSLKVPKNRSPYHQSQQEFLL